MPETVHIISGPPGSGKSRQLIRMALAAPGPVLVLALTPRNRQRLIGDRDALAPDHKASVQIHTLDAFLLALINRHAERAYHLLSELEAETLVHGLLQQSVGSGHPLYAASRSPALGRAVYGIIRDWRHEALSPDAIAQRLTHRPDTGWLIDTYTRFCERLDTTRRLIFPDLPHRACQASWDAWHDLYAIALDEAQELSPVHYHWLSLAQKPVWLAGDGSVSIRRYRHAAPERFSSLPVTTALTQTYRSGADRRVGLLAPDALEEAEHLAAWLREYVSTEGIAWHECAVLLRSSLYKPLLLEAFARTGVPVQDHGISPRAWQARQDCYDLLQALHNLAELPGLPESHQAEAIHRINRHLGRWLMAHLSDQMERDDVRRQLLHSDQAMSLLLETLQAEPPADATAQCLQRFAHYRSLAEAGDMVGLATEALADAGVPDVLARIRSLDTHAREILGAPMSLADWLEWYEALWQSDTAEPADGVQLLSYHQAQGEEFACVAMPFLVQDEWPPHRLPLDGWQETDPDREAAEEARLFRVGLTRARAVTWLSAHQSHRNEPVLPCRFFDEQAAGLQAPPAVSMGMLERLPAADFEGSSAWARFARESDAPLYAPDDTLYLSASHLKTYMTCPRQYYYKHLLKLPTGDSPAATLGSLIHRLFEVFNTGAEASTYTAQRFLALIDTFFAGLEQPESFLACGFTEADRRTLARMNPMSRADLEHRLRESVRDLEEKGYFHRYAGLQTVEAEKTWSGVRIEGIDGCRFEVKLDALIQGADGQWDIVDYKTYGRAYGKSRLETCERRFEETLDPLPDDPALDHRERFRDKLSDDYPKDYQLPLYYLTCRQQAPYRGRIREVALQIVRPGSPDQPEQGAIRLALSAEAIDAAAEQLASDIRRYIIEPIRGTAHFSGVPDAVQCGRCGYAEICDAADAVEAEVMA